MLKKLYKVYFWATETTLDGREETRLHAVYMPRVDENRKTLTIAEQIERGTEALKKERLYNIKYGSTIAVELIFA